MARLVAAYAELSTRRPYSVAFASCTFKGMLADAFSQRVVEGRSEQDWKRTGVFAFYGGWYCGWFQHALYNVGYASLFGVETTLYNAAEGRVRLRSTSRSAFHWLISTQVCFPVYYAYKHVLYDGDGWRAGLERYKGEAADMCRRYYTVWVPEHARFTVVPVPLRIGFIATTSFGWLTAASFFTHQH
ncbi:cGMP-dependent protein kinase [Aureococcus anophagefferens]|nr:cGMP-dependent protein kinase [Aureococcus anophagefferens]